MVKGKSINSLMRHLRNKHNIDIKGSKNKRDLLNMGYYHGYKGYRFINNSENIIPYSDFDEIVSVYEFDANLKALLYPRLMFIETAIKNRTLDTLISDAPVDFEYVFTNFLNDYKNENTGNSKYRKKMRNRLELRNKIYETVSYNYREEKAVIQHFFHQNKPLPLWAIFEVISMGDFGFFLQCLNKDNRIQVSKDLNLHSTSHNQNGRIVEDIIFLIKDLRNAVAHNSIIFDCRFQKAKPQSRLKEFLQNETRILNINFRHIIDYFLILIVILKKMGVPKKELKKVIRILNDESERLRSSIPDPVHTSVMSSEYRRKLEGIKTYI
ncbi:Abi family protein [Alkalibacillus haloalkaliphilus]|uniref:Abi family protein n=1 Tax=Alkalibacillus haloalkaliphilus TaxID=94136 RepID=UPI0029354103|nr:Abi family protein [Alkalibacillus haloalkaliphilus]MDV2581688.1 Abi family protein [Alkalibacillus haloalkaliphilus]